MLLSICERCRRPVADGEGVVAVSYRDIRLARAARWRAMELLLSAGMLRLGHDEDWDDFLVHRPQARWTVRHAGCDRRRSPRYSIPVERLRTRADFIEWTSHLVRKEWLLETDWDHLMADANAGHGRRLSFSPALVDA